MKNFLLFLVTNVALSLSAAEANNTLEPSINHGGIKYFSGEQFKSSKEYLKYYEQGAHNIDNDFAYIGRRKLLKPLFNALKNDEKLQHTVNYPELDKEKWSLENDMAFMAGAIEHYKNFYVAAKLSWLAETKSSPFLKRQLIWLKTNGYRFYVDSQNFMWAFAPFRSGNPKQAHIKIAYIENLKDLSDYRNGEIYRELIKDIKPLPNQKYYAKQLSYGFRKP